MKVARGKQDTRAKSGIIWSKISIKKIIFHSVLSNIVVYGTESDDATRLSRTLLYEAMFAVDAVCRIPLPVLYMVRECKTYAQRDLA